MDSGKILTVLTKFHGKLTLMSKGAMRPKSGMGSAASLFCCSEFNLYRGRDFCYPSSAVIKEMFYGLRSSTETYAAACYMAELCDKLLLYEEYENSKMYEMLYEAFRVLEKNKSRNIVAAFQIKSACILGVRPELNRCVHCGDINSNSWIFDVKEGGLSCDRCSNASFKISKGEIDFLKYLIVSRFADLGEIKFSYRIFFLLNAYLLYQFEIAKIKSEELLSFLYRQQHFSKTIT